MGWLELVLLILASFRLTHLVVFDSITEGLRDVLKDRPFMGALVSCYWCAGIWVSAGIVLLDALWRQPLRPLMLILAVAGGQVLLERMVQSREP